MTTTAAFGQTTGNGVTPAGKKRRGRKAKAGSEVPRQGSVRKPELLIGLALVVVCVLGVLYFFNQASSASPVVAVGSDIARGDVIGVEDLQIVDVATTDSLNVVTASELDELVGRIAVTDLKAGTLLTRQQLSGSSDLADGEAIVGMTLKPGNVPTASLQPGTVVEVLLTPVAGDADALTGNRPDRLKAARADVLVAAEVVEVSPVGTQGDVFVSLEMGEDEAALVAQAVSLGRVRLIKVGGQS